MELITVLAAALLLLSPPAVVPQEPSSENLLDRAAPACVQIRSYGKTMAAGSGFVFGARNVVVTSARVVAGASRNVVIDRAGNAHRAIGLVKDAPNDIAVILLDDEIACTPFEAAAEAAAGTPAFLVGFPLSRPEISLLSGTVSDVRDPGTFAVSTPVGPGASGAAILNAQGELLGIASRTEAGTGIVVPATFVAAVAKSASQTAKPETVAGAEESDAYSSGRDRGEIVDDPTDANGEFAPAREAIENARRREAERSRPPMPPIERTPGKTAPILASAPKVATQKTPDPRAATTVAFARFWGGLFERKARWYLASDSDADNRRNDLLEFVRDPAHRSALAETGPFQPGEWERALVILESEIEEIGAERGDPERLVAADERLVTRMRRRLWTADLTTKLDAETFLRELAPAAATAPLFGRFHAVADPSALGAVVAFSANPELQTGDKITALVLDGGDEIPVRSLRQIAATAGVRMTYVGTGNVALVIRRGGRTLLIGEPAR